jgi:hypothetical protein
MAIILVDGLRRALRGFSFSSAYMPHWFGKIIWGFTARPFTARPIYFKMAADPACFLDSMIGSYGKLRSPLTGE